ncbi:MAG TPA: nuclear transport factor 2 family protein [Casimicrobiaceae bacterium]|nr:nuclear transport factor 2 family protein [Casimicrobiaceae bacterium]
MHDAMLQKRVIILLAMSARHQPNLLRLAAILLAVMLSTLTSAHEPDAQEIALRSLIDAELGFARMAHEQGVRAAFLANFADDGIAFEPAPVRLHQAWSARPAPADPMAVKLEWQPAQVGVSRSHDMGYSTGPYTLTDSRQPGVVRHGVFFSVWQRNAHGTWKVGLDAGITTPDTVDFVALGAAPRPTFTGRGNVQVEQRRLLAIERRTHEAAEVARDQRAYGTLLATDARLHREGMAPVAGRARVAAEMASRAQRIEWSPIEARVARSADMAVTYGRYRETKGTNAASEGYYAHLWLRDRAGVWRLAYDIARPAS